MATFNLANREDFKPVEPNEWHVSMPESIAENIKYNGAIFGSYQEKTRKIFVYDTVSFPEKAGCSNRIGYILNANASTADQIAALMFDGNDIVSGEFVDSELKLTILPEISIYSDGRCSVKEDCSTVMISVRENCNTISDENDEELRFFNEE